ncbi:MAG: ATP phosphoribosyltransferase regulatory subunit, partial [Oscillospiraceae bacterium]|nr:ATP phosphoribosyltransferase regulatory subunit [Oscillospiraceae bacterium]
MDNTFIRKKDETVTQGLRALFERRGFTQVRVNQFEDYDMYVENRNFLDSDNIITFMDMDGKLKCMKPDVTLSVVKNIAAGRMAGCEKLYYVDEVCRLSRESREYKMLGQVGVELIGPADALANLEAVDLALESLAVIGGRHVLDISHLGFVSGLLDGLVGETVQKDNIMRALHSKSPHIIDRLLADQHVSERDRARIKTLAGLSGPILDILPRAAGLIDGSAMRDAYRELELLGEMLIACGSARRVNLDFSVINDLDYYNGLIFHGYVEGLPDAVLTGGRYDNL